MEKLLTISIAAYNVGQYLHQALSSLCVPEILDEIEETLKEKQFLAEVFPYEK